MTSYQKDKQYYKFCAYGFLKNLRFYDAFLLLFFLENGVSYSQIGILYAAREIIINIIEIPSGIIADTYGRKNSLIGAFLAYILGFFVFYISTDFTLLLIAILLIGVGDAFRSGSHKGMIMDYLKLNNWEKHKVEYYGNTRSWSQKGSAVSALVAGIFVFYSGNYRAIYLLSTIPYLLNFVNIASYPNELNYSSKPKKKEKPNSIKSVFKDFIIAMKNPQIFYVINSAALHSSFLKSVKDYIQPILVQIAVLIPIMMTLDVKRKSGLIIGIVYFIIFLLTSQASKNAHNISKLISKNVLQKTLLCGVLAGLISGLMLHFEFWIFSLLFFVLIYLIENIRKPILTGTLADTVPNEILTSVLSAQSFYGTIVTSILAVLIGVFADYFGIGASLIVVSSLLIILIFAIESFKKANISQI